MKKLILTAVLFLFIASSVAYAEDDLPIDTTEISAEWEAKYNEYKNDSSGYDSFASFALESYQIYNCSLPDLSVDRTAAVIGNYTDMVEQLKRLGYGSSYEIPSVNMSGAENVFSSIYQEIGSPDFTKYEIPDEFDVDKILEGAVQARNEALAGLSENELFVTVKESISSASLFSYEDVAPEKQKEYQNSVKNALKNYNNAIETGKYGNIDYSYYNGLAANKDKLVNPGKYKEEYENFKKTFHVSSENLWSDSKGFLGHIGSNLADLAEEYTYHTSIGKKIYDIIAGN